MAKRPANQAGTKYFDKSVMIAERPSWADEVTIDPRKLNARRAWVRALAAEYTGEAMQALVECLKDSDASVRIKAAQGILDRAWGKPETVRDPVEAAQTDANDLLRRITSEVTRGRTPIDAGTILLPERGGQGRDS